MNGIQVMMLIHSLKIEIETWDTHRLQMTREPALASLKRLSGYDFGRGLRARQRALEWLVQVAEDNNLPITKR